MGEHTPEFHANLAAGEQGQNFIKTVLAQSGYTVIPYGIEHHIVTLKQEIRGLYQTDTQRRLHHMPDFVVIDPNTKEVWLVEVKNKPVINSYRKDTEIYTKYHNVKDIIDLWVDTVLTVTMPVAPYCICVFVKDIDWNKDYNGKTHWQGATTTQDKWSFHRIEKKLTDIFPRVKPELLEKNAHLLAPPKKNNKRGLTLI